jgi:hypothetical protein
MIPKSTGDTERAPLPYDGDSLIFALLWCVSGREVRDAVRELARNLRLPPPPPEVIA